MDKNELIKEQMQLILWFNNYYLINEQKFRRLNTLNKLCDNGTSPYENLRILYEEAEVKRARIQEIEKLLGIEQ